MVIDTALFLTDYLVRNGIERVYVVPDPEVATILNAFRLRGVEIVATPDPLGGAMVAAAESVMHRGSGVIVSGSGPSAAAVAPAVAQAQLDRRSLIVITVEPNGAQPRSTARRALDLRAIFASVSKGSYRLSADNARELVPLAWRLATSIPRGVVHLRVHHDELMKRAATARGQAHPPAPPPNEEYMTLLRRATDLITAARRIVLLVGPEAIDARAEAAARLLAEQWGAPIVVTPMAKGAIPETDPAFAGVYGAAGDYPIIELIRQSDLVVAFGTTSTDFVRPWHNGVPTIHLTESGADSGIPADVVLVGPLNALANDLPRTANTPEPREEEILAALTRRGIQDALGQPGIERQPLTPQYVLTTLRRLAASDLPLAVETDQAGLLAAQLWRVTEPGAFLISNGLGLPGSGLALAIAVAFHFPQRGAIWFGTDAMLTTRPSLLGHLRGVRASLPLIVINQAIHIELLREQESAGYPHIVSEYRPLDLAALANTYELGYARASTADELTDALAAAFTAGHPTLVDVHGDHEYWWRLG